MDIKKCSLFADVAETNNFTRSGDRMGYTQSGVSHILKSLENEIGFPLFIRTKQGVQLTKNAQQILPLVRSLLAVNAQLEQTIGELNNLETGSLTIATFSSISIHWLPKIIHEFQLAYPGIDITLMEGTSEDIADWVSNSVADFGFMSRRHVKDLDFIPLCKEPLMAVVPKGYPITSNGYFPISNFQDQDFIISSRGTDVDIQYVLHQYNIKPRIRFSSKDDHAIISMIANHLGISILPQLVLRNFEHDVDAYPISPSCTRELGIAVRSSRNILPAAERFLEITHRILPSLL